MRNVIKMSNNNVILTGKFKFDVTTYNLTVTYQAGRSATTAPAMIAALALITEGSAICKTHIHDVLLHLLSNHAVKDE